VTKGMTDDVELTARGSRSIKRRLGNALFRRAFIYQQSNGRPGEGERLSRRNKALRDATPDVTAKNGLIYDGDS